MVEGGWSRLFVSIFFARPRNYNEARGGRQKFFRTKPLNAYWRHDACFVFNRKTILKIIDIWRCVCAVAHALHVERRSCLHDVDTDGGTLRTIRSEIVQCERQEDTSKEQAQCIRVSSSPSCRSAALKLVLVNGRERVTFRSNG